LSFEVIGLSEATLAELEHLNLHVTPTVALFCHSKGIVIPDRPGDIFVNGLFVAHLENYKYGYNFKPEHLSLDRDRRLVRDFDVQWLTSQIWKDYEDYALVLDMIATDQPDVKYLDSFIHSAKQGLADEAAKAFIIEHGPEAIPVTTQFDLNRAKEDGHETIILVPDTQRQLIRKSELYVEPAPKVVKKTPREILLDFQRKYLTDVFTTPGLEDDFNEIIEQAERWYC
jgi:hypothetical protein